MAEKPFPTNEAETNLLIQNLAAKLPGLAGTLGVASGDVDFIVKQAPNYAYLVTIAQQVSDAKESFTAFKKAVFEGDPVATPPAPPTFPAVSPPSPVASGIENQVKAIIKRIKSSAGYNDTIGEELGLVDGGNNLIDPNNLTAELKFKVLGGSEVQISFSKQGQDAMRVEFRRKGDTKWGLAGVFTSSPGIHDDPPASPGDPESRDYRGTLIKKNKPIGNPSPTYTIVTTP